MNIYNLNVSNISQNVKNFSQTDSGAWKKDYGLSIVYAIFLFNLSSIPVVILFKKIGRPLKIMLLNLTASDIIFLLMGIVYGVLDLNKRSYGPLCAIVCTVMQGTLSVSYTTAVALASNNCLAVRRPFVYRRWMTTKRMSLIVLLMWVVMLITSSFSQISSSSTGTKCVVLSVIPRFALGFFAVYCFCCSVVVIVLNFWVAKKVRSLARTQPRICNTGRYPVCSVNNRTDKQPQSLSQSGDKRISIVDMSSPRSTLIHRSRSRETTSFVTPSLNIRSPLPSSLYQRRPSFASGQHFLRAPSTSLLPKSHVPPTSFHVQLSENSIVTRTIQTGSLSTPHCRNKLGLHVPRESQNSSFRLQVQKLDTPGVFTPQPLGISDQPAPLQNHGRPKSRPAKMSTLVTMLVFAAWNTITSLPVIILWLWIALATAEGDSAEFAQTRIGKSLSWFSLGRCITNPFLCMWCFIEWEKLFRRCRVSR